MARVTGASGEARGSTTGGSASRSPARGVLAPQPGRRNALESEAAAIVQQLSDAGVNLSDVRDNLAAAMRNEPVGFSVDALRILNTHFPQMYQVGLGGNPLAAALHHALPRSAAAPRRGLAPAEPRRRATGGSSGGAQTPPRIGETSARGRPARGANASLMGRLAGSGIDMGHVAAAIDNAVRRGIELPDEIRGVLARAGIETHLPRRPNLSHPLLQLRREIYDATPEERDPSPPRAERPAITRRPRGLNRPLPAIGTSRSPVPDATSARAGLTMPERAAGETNAQYAWRLHNLNPGVSLERLAAAAVGPSGHMNVRPTLAQLSAMVKLHNDTAAMFNDLRLISKDDAERLGFKDAATHGEDEATDCVFGEPLSTTNPNQRVIALAQVPSHESQPHSAGVVFMDMNQLAAFLTTKPVHPMNGLPLTPDNLHEFAFKIA